MTWTIADIQIVLDPDATEDPVVTGVITTPDGTLQVMAEPREVDGCLVLDGLHLHGSSGPNGLGVAKLRRLAELVLEKYGYDEILIRGAFRTTGAKPGRKPGDLRFARKSQP